MKTALRLIVVLLFLQATILQSNAQDVFLKMNGPGSGPYGEIKGDSRDEDHKDEIEVGSYSHAIAGCASAAKERGNSGKVSCTSAISDFNFMMIGNSAVVPLTYYALTGLSIPSADLVVEKRGDKAGEPFMFMRMEEIVVSSIQQSASGGGGEPVFAVSLSAKRIAWGTRKQKPDGTVDNNISSVGWDVVANKPWSYNFAVRATSY